MPIELANSAAPSSHLKLQLRTRECAAAVVLNARSERVIYCVGDMLLPSLFCPLFYPEVQGWGVGGGRGEDGGGGANDVRYRRIFVSAENPGQTSLKVHCHWGLRQDRRASNSA